MVQQKSEISEHVLLQRISAPTVIEQILGTYSGDFSLGIIRHGQKRQLAIELQVEGEISGSFRESLSVNGFKIPIVVKDASETPKGF